jgi:hypothetical protein
MATSQRGVRSARPKHAGAVLAARVAHRCVARSATGVGLHHAGRVPARDAAARLDADCSHLTLRHRPTGCDRESHPRVAPEAWAVLLRPPSSSWSSSSSTAARGSPSSWPPRALSSSPAPTADGLAQQKAKAVEFSNCGIWEKNLPRGPPQASNGAAERRCAPGARATRHCGPGPVSGSEGGASGRRGTWPSLLGDGATPCRCNDFYRRDLHCR